MLRVGLHGVKGFGTLLRRNWRLSVSPVLFLLLCGDLQAGTLEDIRGRGVVTCAVPAKAPGISDTSGSKRAGLAVDLCAVFAVALLGRAEAVAYIDVNEGEGVLALQAGEADILLVPGHWRFLEEVNDGVFLLEPLLQRSSDGQVFGPMVRQGDDAWLVTIRWLIETLRRGPDIVPPGVAESAANQLGLQPGWEKNIFIQSISYDELLNRHLKPLQEAGWTSPPGAEGMSFDAAKP